MSRFQNFIDEKCGKDHYKDKKKKKKIDEELSDSKLKQIKSRWERIAKENLEIENIKGTIYAYGSELATLRLLKDYRETKKAKADYSLNMKKYYFRLEM